MRSSQRSQSEVIGVVLLIGVVTTLVFLVGGATLTTFLSEGDTPHVDIDAEATTQNVTIAHAEGDSLVRDDIELILEGDTSERYQLSEFTQLRGNDTTRFEPGDEWSREHGINTDRMTVLLIHQPTNTILDRETVDVVETLAVRFSTNATTATTANDPIEFDASESTDPDGTIANYTWTFDDGTTTETTDAVVTHSYDASGTYDVRLSVNTSDGRTRALTKTVTVFPTANFTFAPSNPFEGNNVTFNTSNSGAGTGAIAEYEWNFGDGTTNTTSSEEVEHNYSTPGSYFVSLTVRDSDGVKATDSATVQVRNEVANLQLNLTPDAAGADAVHNWSFDDVDFAGNQNDDEVDTITVDYSGTGASFDGLDDGNITVVLTRDSGGPDTAEIDVNADTYSGESATFDLSGIFETSIVGSGYVRIDGLENPPVGQDYQAEITFSGADTVSSNTTFDTTTPAKKLTLTPDNSTVAPGQPNDITVDVADQAGNSLDEEVNVTVASGNGTFENGNQNVTVQTGSNGQTTVNYTAAASDKNTEIQLDGKLTSNTSVTDSATFNVSGGTGAFRGTVDDGDGNPLTQTDVTLSAEDGSFTRTVQTNDTGRYNVTNVPEGTYNITASATGYQSATNDSVAIVEGETTTGVDYTLTNTVENLTLDVTPSTPGDDAVHNWSFDNVDFGDNENDQVETITLNYSGTGASFDGLTDENVTVVLTRNLSSGPDTSEISVNSATYSGDSITIDLSGSFETSIVGAGYVSVEDVTNPSGIGTYNASITFDGPADTASATQSFTVTEPGFVGTSITDVVPSANEQDQTVRFTLEGGLDQGESVVVNLTEPQNGALDYANSASAFVVNTDETTGDVSLDQNNGITTLTYTPQQAGGDDYGTEVIVRLRGVAVDNTAATYTVEFDRTDNGAGTEAETFETARGSGQPNLAVDIENVTVSDSFQNVTLTPKNEQFNDSERVAIELDEPYASDSADPPKIQYQDVSVLGSGTGQIVSFSEINNSETAYVIYEAPGTNAASLNNVTLELDIENAEIGDNANVSFDVGVSRATADTVETNFSLASPASFNVTDIAPNSTGTGITESVTVTVTNEGGLAGNQTIEYDLQAYSVAVIDQGETHGEDIAATLESELSGHQGEYVVDTLTAEEALDSVGEYNTVVVQRMSDQYADQLISAIETNDTTAVYLGQWRDINDQYTEPDSSYSDGFARLAQYHNTNYVRSQDDTPLSSSEPVVIDVERNHPLFDGVTTAGNAFPVHNQDWSDRVWLTNYEGTTYGTVRHESESTGTGGPAVLVGEEEILLGMGRSNFVPNSAYTADANTVLGNAVANLSQPTTVQTTTLSLAPGENGTVTFQVEMPEQNGTYTHQASSANDTLVESIDVSKTSFTGQITDGTGDPVANTEVRLSGDGLEKTVTTDANGVYTVEDVPAGTYDLVANADGYEESTQVTTEFVQGTTTNNVDFVLPDVTVWGSGQLEGFLVQNLDATVTVSTADGSTVEFVFDIDWFFGYTTQEITIDGVTYTLTDDAVQRADGSLIDLLDPANYQGLDSADEQRIREIRERITEGANVSTITENEGSVEIEISEEDPN
jgi:PKD repeat protein